LAANLRSDSEVESLTLRMAAKDVALPTLLPGVRRVVFGIVKKYASTRADPLTATIAKTRMKELETWVRCGGNEEMQVEWIGKWLSKD
jgi:hypothetical protein